MFLKTFMVCKQKKFIPIPKKLAIATTGWTNYRYQLDIKLIQETKLTSVWCQKEELKIGLKAMGISWKNFCFVFPDILIIFMKEFFSAIVYKSWNFSDLLFQYIGNFRFRYSNLYHKSRIHLHFLIIIKIASFSPCEVKDREKDEKGHY